MCRLLIILTNNYLKKDIIEEFLSQTNKLKNTPLLNNERDHDFHKDGYGFIFYNLKNQVSIYKSPLEYKKDYIKHSFTFFDNLLESSKILIGHIRATKFHFKDDICFNNTHPFWINKNYMMHNGCIYPFKRENFMKYISNKYIKHIKGTTDSEILLYIFMSLKDEFKDDLLTWKHFFIFLDNLFQEENIIVSANIVISNSKYIMISRYINNEEEPPSLYFSKDKNIISSEPVIDSYELIPKNTSIIYNLDEKSINIEDITSYYNNNPSNVRNTK